MMECSIKIKMHDKHLPRPEHKALGDWVDLRAAETVELKAGESHTISLGVSMQLPSGYEAHLVPRSSTFRNFGVLLVNGTGIIDNSYCGNNDVWGFPAYATCDTVIHKGDRIAQFRIMPCQPKLTFEEVDDLPGKDRGGFGSTGIR